MQILIFEWLTGGGLWIDGVSFHCGAAIRSQGKRMLQAIAQDFLIAGIEVILPIDERSIGDFPAVDGLTLWPVSSQVDLGDFLKNLAKDVDRILLIAPETGARLLNCVQWLESFREKFLSPVEEFVRIASSKQASFNFLQAQGFDGVSRGMEFADFLNGPMDNFGFPMVIKPMDGVGGEGLRLIKDCEELEQLEGQLAGSDYWVEPFYQGVPVSVSVICHGDRFTFLPATEQVFDREPFGDFIGSRFPVHQDLECRARRLAEKTIRLLPPTQGYVGLDMVLGAEGDQLIEVNPRLTMSYLKLRQVCAFNLATRMLGPSS
jgi:predicted ATP-grasp superfamily ATP-dependent carboligase